MKLRFWAVWLTVALAPCVTSGEVCGWWAEYVVNTYTSNYQKDPRVAERGDGSFIVASTDHEALKKLQGSFLAEMEPAFLSTES